MMFKAAIIGDIHLSDTPPKTRKDDYQEAIFKKLLFILQYCTAKDINTLIFLGDFFHKSNPIHTSHSLVSRVISLFQLFPLLKKYSIVGNHDLQHNIDLFYRQPLNTLFQAGVINRITAKSERISEDPLVELAGQDYSQDTEADPSAYSLCFSDDSAFKIGVFHSTLLPDGDSFFGSWVNFKEVSYYCQADLVCVGHYHPGFAGAVIRAHDKLWVNPGALSRGTLEQHNLERDPSFVIVGFDEKGVIYKVMPIPVEPAEAVFDFSAKERAVRQNKEATVFAEKVALLGGTEALTSVDSLIKTVEALDIDPAVRKFAIRHLTSAGDALGE